MNVLSVCIKIEDNILLQTVAIDDEATTMSSSMPTGREIRTRLDLQPYLRQYKGVDQGEKRPSTQEEQGEWRQKEERNTTQEFTL